jgi:hypothetical protein
MSRKAATMDWKIILIMLVLFLLIALSQKTNIAPASAQSGGTYDLTWSTIDGGGGMFSTGGTYELSGTIGQPDAGKLSGGIYTLNGGFWNAFANSVSTNINIYLPFIRK